LVKGFSSKGRKKLAQSSKHFYIHLNKPKFSCGVINNNHAGCLRQDHGFNEEEIERIEEGKEIKRRGSNIWKSRSF
jgi:hypothetical protein